MQQRLFEDLIESDVVAHKTKQGYTLPVSIAIHAIVLLAVVVVPLLTSEELPEPTSVVKAFFVEPAAPPPQPRSTSQLQAESGRSVSVRREPTQRGSAPQPMS